MAQRSRSVEAYWFRVGQKLEAQAKNANRILFMIGRKLERTPLSMKTELPQYSNSAKLGDLGVSIVARIVSDSFGWLFKRNHQEHDFGIDGQIELVTESGAVTGQLLAVQIKCGKSFIKETNEWGYVYRGERKHFNYLVNYPIPVMIVLCDPDSSECYWTQFPPEATESTDVGWKITVPFENKLATSKGALTALVAPVRDGFAELQEYWEINKLIVDSSIILYILDEFDVKHQEVAKPRAFFDRLRTTKELAASCQGKVEIMFSGYEDDPRKLFEIDEVREYVAKLDSVLPDLFFFARSEQPTFTLMIFALCQTKFEFAGDHSPAARFKQVYFDALPVVDFIERHCPALNELTEWLNMPLDDEKRLYFDVVRCLSIKPPDEEKHE
jgi:hypothetical protein